MQMKLVQKMIFHSCGLGCFSQDHQPIQMKNPIELEGHYA